MAADSRGEDSGGEATAGEPEGGGEEEEGGLGEPESGGEGARFLGEEERGTEFGWEGGWEVRSRWEGGSGLPATLPRREFARDGSRLEPGEEAREDVTDPLRLRCRVTVVMGELVTLPRRERASGAGEGALRAWRTGDAVPRKGEPSREPPP